MTLSLRVLVPFPQHTEFCTKKGLTFPLLSDTSGAVSKAYGGAYRGVRTAEPFSEPSGQRHISSFQRAG